MENSGRVLIFTGDGKGKTTAALGMALRASGHGMRVRIIQFVKADPSTGEFKAVGYLPGVEMLQTGLGFLPDEENAGFEDHRAAAREGLKIASESLESGRYDLVILDEVCFAVARKLLDEREVVEAIRRAGPDTCVVMTGRGATPGLIAIADTVTEMVSIKHGMTQGLPARAGVEF